MTPPSLSHPATPGLRDPLDALLRAPRDQPVAIVVDANEETGDRSTIVASPRRAILLDDLDHDAIPPTLDSGGWIVTLAYELGARLEPTARIRNRPPTLDLPRIVLLECPDAWAHDRRTDRWTALGSPRPFVASAAPEEYEIDPFTSDMGRANYERAVEQTIAYIHAGDVFQANIAHRLAADYRGDRRTLAHDLLRRADAPHAAYLELPADDAAGRPPHAIASISPELFLRYDHADRRVVTRPIKGTDRTDQPAERLERSEKDRAELVMIMDLMRNDLGRVCEYGSVRVPVPRAIETHGHVRHAVGVVSGRLREDQSVTDLIHAAFPPGSITGAPKVRAMQIIDELERSDRGPYCGAIGWLACNGDMTLNVAIRTALITTDPDAPNRGRVEFGVGAGIVADSVPALEWRETLDKAATFLDAVGGRLAPDLQP